MNKGRLWGAVLAGLMLAGLTGCQSGRDELVENAINGSAFHQAMLADAYLNGYGFKIDYQLAGQWAKQAAAQHDPDGMYLYGTICEYGLGDQSMDFHRAEELYEAALPGLKARAEKGNPQALYDLGTAYLYGRGVPRDYAVARVMLENAERKGFIPATAKLGQLMLWDAKVDRDDAKQRLLRVAKEGIPEAQCTLGGLYREAKNFRAARNWYQHAADANYPPAMTALAEMNRDGNGMAVNRAAAIELLQRAVAANYPPAMLELADLYRQEPATRDQAIKLYQDAIGKDSAPACRQLAELYGEMSKTQPALAVRAMRLYQLAGNFNVVPDYAARMAELDRELGLFYFIQAGEQDVKQPSAYLKYGTMLPGMLAVYQNGQEAQSHRQFQQALSKDALALYEGNDWYELQRQRLPASWTGELLQVVAKTESGKPFFWLCYGTCANLAGRPELAMTAVDKLEKTADRIVLPHEAEKWKTLACVIRTEALLQRGRSDRAYELLASDPHPVATATLGNYIRHCCPALMADRERYGKATGLSEVLAGENKAGPVPSAQAFYDYSAGAITLPQALVPEPEIRKDPRFIPTNW